MRSTKVARSKFCEYEKQRKAKEPKPLDLPHYITSAFYEASSLADIKYQLKNKFELAVVKWGEELFANDDNASSDDDEYDIDEDCLVCGGTGAAYVSDGVFGVCLDCDTGGE